MKRFKDIKLTLRHKLLFLAGSVFIVLASVGGSYLGVNVTPSVPFYAYYHTSVEGHEIKPGDYILFEIPENQLYKIGLNVVKKASCIHGQYLKSVPSEGKIEYFCDGVLITTATVFTRWNYERLEIFSYDGLIPDGSYFVTGEHYKSYDSRYWGFVTADKIRRIVHPLAAADLFVSSACAAGFYSERDKGWYKYEITPKKEKEDDNAPDNLTHMVMVKPVIPWERVSTMPPKEFKQLFEDVQDYAMTYRTLENFDTYAKLRAVMFRRSVEFMNVSTLWGQLNPEDSSETWFPSSGFGQDVYIAQADEKRSSYIYEHKDSFGLLYFYRTDCAFCRKQTPLIKYFEDESGWAVKAVNTDVMPDAMLRFNVKSVPTLILVERDTGRWLLISSGLTTVEEIKERLYRTIKYLKGETDETNFSELIHPDNLVKSGAGRVDR